MLSLRTVLATQNDHKRLLSPLIACQASYAGNGALAPGSSESGKRCWQARIEAAGACILRAAPLLHVGRGLGQDARPLCLQRYHKHLDSSDARCRDSRW